MTDPVQPAAEPARGPIAWMVHNRVTPHLIMLFFIIGGLILSTRIKQEVFPEFSLDMVEISVAYPGASPEEVEQGIVLSVEEAVRGIEGVKEVTATAGEGIGRVNVELLIGADQQKVYQDIKQEVDRITTFPEEAEQPQVTLQIRRREVLDLQIYGDASEWSLRHVAEEVRDRLLQDPRITQVEMEGVRDYELRVEVSQDRLRAHGLTLNEVAQRIRQTAVEVPGGGIRSESGEILLRFKERRDWASEFARMPVITTPSGAQLALGDIARVTDDFEETDRFGEFNGVPSVGIVVYRVGDQTPIGVSDAVRDAMKSIARALPEGVDYAVRRDLSDIYRQRLHLLLKNAFMGLALVLLLLGLFLEFRLAFWVTMGIPTAFLGTLLFLPVMDVSINMISMFAFIIALGIVVDDAIVAGENIYEYRQQGLDMVTAAIRGARDVAVPIAFSILTNIVAFLPLSFIPGMLGKTWKVIPFVVITAFLLSWLESLLILPSHLAHVHRRRTFRLAEVLHRRQQAFSRQIGRFTERVYAPLLGLCLRWRYLTLAVAVATLMIIIGQVRGGRIGMILMPRVEADYAIATATLPYGSPLSRTAAVRDHLVAAAEEVVAASGGARLSEGLFAEINDNSVEVRVYLTDANTRPISTTELTQRWRQRAGSLAGLQSLVFQADRGGPSSGAALTVELSHRDIAVLDRASAALAQRLEEFANVRDVDSGYSRGKQQLDFVLKPEGRSLGLTTAEVARQVRHAFYGAEALRQQRGRNEVKVMVRLPREERLSEYDIETLLIRTPSGRHVPLLQVADVERGRSYTAIHRREGRRTVSVSADVSPLGETGQVQAALDATVLPQLARDFPGLTYGYEGRQAEMRDSMRSLYAGFGLSLFAIYFLLAIPFRSYIQPLIVMLSIPFGIVGAILGHMIMGYNLSVISIMGMIALAGVVVNGSLVLIDMANRERLLGLDALAAIQAAGVRRFRPILLTTLTTFGGLAPMIFETSRQARFMIPMALSLGYGIVFATAISLLIVPSLYMAMEDLKGLFRGNRP